MNRSIWLWILILILWLIFGTWLCNKYLCGNSIAAAAPVAAATEGVKERTKTAATAALGNWIYRDGNLRINNAEHFRFRKSNFNPLARSAKFNASLNQTADYLKNNSARSLMITGYYKSDETNSSILDNLGMARANNVKNIMTSMGVPANQLDIRGELLPKAFWYKNDTMMKGIDFAFSAKATGANTRVADIRSRLVGKPLTLYFGTNQDQISLNAQQRKNFGDMIYYLDNVNTAKINIGGHTDNVGNRSYNTNLSKQRADFVKNYLIQNGGISNAKMNTNGFGPDKPVSTNNTSDGRAKNRRVEVTLR